MLDLGNASEAEVREALGSGFPKHPLHKIVCIGALIASRQPEGWRVDALGAPHIGGRPEAKLISDFLEKIGELLPQLITFNGHSFDLPVLRYRAMVNRISAAGLQVRPYFHRYAEDALDLCDVLGSYVPGSKVKLHDPTDRARPRAIASPVPITSHSTETWTRPLVPRLLPPAPCRRTHRGKGRAYAGGTHSAATNARQQRRRVATTDGFASSPQMMCVVEKNHPRTGVQKLAKGTDILAVAVAITAVLVTVLLH
jgi:Predicted 3'-5' exonuclease related to the exonuclease domain of PolB